MKSLVLWSSRTGNTKAIAEAVYEALPGEKDIFEANLFTFGVIGDHTIPVSAVALPYEQRPVSAAGR